MPTYLVHGFRWPRPLIRIHIILQNLDDAAAEWLMAPQTTRVMLENFESLYPNLTAALPNLRFIEQYDPMDEMAKSQPHAYVCDIVHEVNLGIDIEEVRGKGLDSDAWGSMIELRDKIAPDQKVAWFVVVCGDTERSAPLVLPVETNGSTGSNYSYSYSRASGSGSSTIRNSQEQDTAVVKPSRGLKKWFSSNTISSGLRKTRSFKDLRQTFSRPSTSYSSAAPPVPPLPKEPMPNSPIVFTSGINSHNSPVAGH